MQPVIENKSWRGVVWGLCAAVAGLLAPAGAQADAIEFTVDFAGFHVQAYDAQDTAVALSSDTAYLELSLGDASIYNIRLNGQHQIEHYQGEVVDFTGRIDGEWTDGRWQPTGGELTYAVEHDTLPVNTHHLVIGPGDSHGSLYAALTEDAYWTQGMLGGVRIPHWHGEKRYDGQLMMDYRPNGAGFEDDGWMRIETALVPEPGSLALVGLGGLLIASRRFRRAMPA